MADPTYSLPAGTTWTDGIRTVWSIVGDGMEVSGPGRWDQVAFRIELQTDPTGGGLWDSGLWDDAEWIDPADDDAFDWLDVTDDYVGASFSSARRPAFGAQFTPGTSTVSLLNPDGDYTLGTAGAVVELGQAVRIVAVHGDAEFTKFRGVVKAVQIVESPGKPPIANVVLRSPTAAIARQNRIAQVPQYGGDLPGVRAARVLDSIRWPLLLRSIDAGVEELQPTTLEGSALDELQAIALAEGGEVFHDDAGSIVLYDRSTVAALAAADPAFTVAAYPDPGVTDPWIAWTAFTASTDVDRIRNHVTIGGADLDPFTAIDEDSIRDYGTSTIVQTDLITTGEVSSWPDDLATALVARFKDPSERYSIVLSGGNDAGVLALLGSSILDVVRVRRYVDDVEVDTLALVEGFAYTIRPGRPGSGRNDLWTVTLITGHVINQED